MNAVIIGAGKIGRGFVGRLLGKSGYELIVVEIDRPLIDALNADHAYTVHMVDVDQTWCLDVGPVRIALHADDREAVARAISETGLLVTSVGARKLPEIAPNIAAGIRRRIVSGTDAPLDCFICENMCDGGRAMRELVCRHLESDQQAYLDSHVGFVSTVIGCVGPPIPPALREKTPSDVLAEPYGELPVDRRALAGPPPLVTGLEVSDNFEAYVARKLYIYNSAHAALAYMGWLKHYSQIDEAAEDPDIMAHVRALWSESSAGMIAEYDIAQTWLDQLINRLPRSFTNRALGDTVLRVGRDPARKIGPDERLVGAARFAEKAGVAPHALSRTIAAALCFDHPEDPLALGLQERLRQQGLDAVLSEVCGIQPDENLADLIRGGYSEFAPDVS